MTTENDTLKALMSGEELGEHEAAPETPAGKPRAKRQPKPEPGAETRRNRIPYGSVRTKLEVLFRDGFNTEYHPHWVNEENLARAQQGGYDFCTKDDIVLGGTAETAGGDVGSHIRQLVGRAETGKPQYAYLMKIPREYYEQDVAERQAEINRIEQLTKSGSGVPIENATQPNIAAETRGYRSRT